MPSRRKTSENKTSENKINKPNENMLKGDMLKGDMLNENMFKGGKKQIQKETIDTLLDQIKQMKQVCVELYSGDETKLLNDIKQASREDVIKNIDLIPSQPDDNTASTDITLTEINELMPLNRNGKTKSNKIINENIDILIKRSELRKRHLLLKSGYNTTARSSSTSESNIKQ